MIPIKWHAATLSGDRNTSTTRGKCRLQLSIIVSNKREIWLLNCSNDSGAGTTEPGVISLMHLEMNRAIKWPPSKSSNGMAHSFIPSTSFSCHACSNSFSRRFSISPATWKKIQQSAWRQRANFTCFTSEMFLKAFSVLGKRDNSWAACCRAWIVLAASCKSYFILAPLERLYNSYEIPQIWDVSVNREY